MAQRFAGVPHGKAGGDQLDASCRAVGGDLFEQCDVLIVPARDAVQRERREDHAVQAVRGRRVDEGFDLIDIRTVAPQSMR
jgi:hypothetical protein